MRIRAIADSAFSRVDNNKFIKYFGVGIVATLIDWALFYALIHYLQVFYMLALAASYIASTAFNFFMNRRYTFRNTYKRVHVQLASFAAVAVLGLGLNEALVCGISNHLSGTASAGLMASRVAATLIVFAWNFILNDRITFRIFR